MANILVYVSWIAFGKRINTRIPILYSYMYSYSILVANSQLEFISNSQVYLHIGIREKQYAWHKNLSIHTRMNTTVLRVISAYFKIKLKRRALLERSEMR